MSEFDNPPSPESLPGIGSYDDALQGRLARQHHDANYVPRTQHLDADNTPRFTNRLFLESSPYLLQHAHNPVNWFPWGDEAFALAKKLRRPILLSIGYATCHWCHVMEEESFENLRIAETLNQHYIAIKVDREERPDVDNLYMTAVQAINGHGGWPLTVWLTPEKIPFFGGTYFPPFDDPVRQATGFLSALETIANLYANEPLKIHTACQELTHALTNLLANNQPSELPPRNVIEQVMAHYTAHFDEHFGGLTPAPKFPSQCSIQLLLREHQATQDATLLTMACKTLDGIGAGGIRDHVGGGFHRYATDIRWLIPHFEKMLYDNALICQDYLSAFQVTTNVLYKHMAEEICEYLLRDMRAPEGGFYAAIDADSKTPEGYYLEGYYYTWTQEEIADVLGNDADVYSEYYHVTHEGEHEGRNVLHTDQLRYDGHIAQCNRRLLAARNQRPSPFIDKKILTNWNALTISALVKTGFVLRHSYYIDQAEQQAHALLDHVFCDGTLYRVYAEGQASTPGFLDDYAFLINGLLDVFSYTGSEHWLAHALTLDAIVASQFEDEQHGGFYINSHQQNPMLVREKPLYDGSIASGNAIQINNCLRLYALTLDERYFDRATKALKLFSDKVQEQPAAFANLCSTIDHYHRGSQQIVLVIPEGQENAAEPFLQIIRQRYLPNTQLVLAKPNSTVTVAQNKPAIAHQVTAYVCEHGRCTAPTTNPQVFENKL